MISKKKIKFVTDSTCDIPADLVQKYDITVVPCFINYGGKSYADDGVELIREKFYDEMPSINPFPTTAAPSPGLAEEKIKQAFQNADHLIIVCVPAKLSAIYNSMRLGMGDLPRDQISLIDSGQTSMGLGWQVLQAARIAEETGDVHQTLNAITGVRANEKLYAAAATMEFLRRGGRVSGLVASIGGLLQIKPIIEVLDGEVLAAGRVRTFKNAMEKLIEFARAQAPLDGLALLHANNEAGAQEMRERLADVAPADTFITNISPTVGAHIGPGSLGVATVNKKWRD